MDSSKIKKGLGRGLSSLIGETKVETKKNEFDAKQIFSQNQAEQKMSIFSR